MASPTTPQRIADEETKLGRSLPASLRERLLLENGGEIETDGAYTDSEEDSVWELGAVADLVTGKKGRSWMGRGLAETTAHEAELWGESWHVPAGTVVIADNGTGDLLLLLADDSYAYRGHETGDLVPVSVRLQADSGEFHSHAI